MRSQGWIRQVEIEQILQHRNPDCDVILRQPHFTLQHPSSAFSRCHKFRGKLIETRVPVVRLDPSLFLSHSFVPFLLSQVFSKGRIKTSFTLRSLSPPGWVSPSKGRRNRCPKVLRKKILLEDTLYLYSLWCIYVCCSL